jgi:hypothetical protein
MKYILILLLSLNVFCESYVCLVDSNNKVSNILIDTAKNRTTLNLIKGTKIIKVCKMIATPDYKNKAWNGTTIVNDDEADSQELLDKKDFNKSVDEILICCFLVLLKYQNDDIKTKTNAQFKDDVIEKYNNRNPVQ